MTTQPTPSQKLDRQTTVPFHLKLFYKTNGFHSVSEFTTTGPLPAHLQIYTWPTCTLRELSHLLTSALPSLLPDPAIGTRLAYRLIYPDTHTPSYPPHTSGAAPRYLAKELGNVVVGASGGGEGGIKDEGGIKGELPSDEEAKVVVGGPMSGVLEGEPGKTLQEARFVIGDFIDVAIFAPGESGAAAAAPLVGSRGRGGYGYEYRGRGRGGDGYGGMRGGENGYAGGGGGFGRMRGYGNSTVGRLGEGVPSGEWRRGERVPEGFARGGSGGYGRGRGRGGY